MKQLKYFTSIILAVTFMTLIGCASTSKSEGGVGEYFSDSVITTKVKTAIFNEDSLKSTDISVKTVNGVVQLSGSVDSKADIAKAGELARKVKGVTSVRNELKVKAK